MEAHSDERQEQRVHSASYQNSVSIQFPILPRHEIKGNVKIEFCQMPPCCFVRFLSTSVLTWIISQIKLAWFSLESFYFASISIYSSKDSHRPIKSVVSVILGHGKLTDSLKIKHTIMTLFYFRVLSKGSDFTTGANFIGFGPRVPHRTRFIHNGKYSTFCLCVTFRYN